MTFTEDDLHEFQRLWRAEFGEDISLDDARQRALELMELLRYLRQGESRSQAS